MSRLNSEEAYLLLLGNECFHCGEPGSVRLLFGEPEIVRAFGKKGNLGNHLILCDACNESTYGLHAGLGIRRMIEKKEREMKVLGYALTPAPDGRADLKRAWKKARSLATRHLA